MLIALTGGIGAGKSTVLKIFETYGVITADTDSIVHRIYEEDEIFHAILNKRWGSKVFKNSKPHRPHIAEIVFNDDLELKWLNNQIHPLVKKNIRNLNSDKLTLVAVPLLYEVDWQKDFYKTVSVWCNSKIQYQRLLTRRWSKQEIEARLKAQIDQSEKLNRSDFGIINNWSTEFLEKQCYKIYKLLDQERT